MAGEWQELLERVRRLNKAVSRLAGFQPDYARHYAGTRR